jgi:hypothetical protein
MADFRRFLNTDIVSGPRHAQEQETGPVLVIVSNSSSLVRCRSQETLENMSRQAAMPAGPEAESTTPPCYI